MFVVACPRCGAAVKIPPTARKPLCPRCRGPLPRLAPPDAPPPPQRLEPPEADESQQWDVEPWVPPAPAPLPEPPMFARRAPTHCYGCGRPLHNEIACRNCDSSFCSEVCIRRHAKECRPPPSPPRPAPPTNPVALVIVLVVVGFLLVCGCFGGLLKNAGVDHDQPAPRAKP